MTRFSPEIFALELTGLCAEVGVDLRFDALLTRAAVEETGGRKRVLGVVIEEKSGPAYYGADMFVDATGDGDLMARAGLPTAVRGNFHTYMGLRITLESCALAARTGNIGAATGYFAGGDATLYGEKHPEGPAALRRHGFRRGQPLPPAKPAGDAQEAPARTASPATW